MINVDNKYFKFCLGTFCAIGGVLIVIILLNSIIRGDSIDPDKTYGPNHNFEVPKKDSIIPPHQEFDCIYKCDTHLFVPTEHDIMVLDTIENQVNTIEKDIDTLHIRINRIEDKIDDLIDEQTKEDETGSNYKTKEDTDWTGTYHDEHVMWISGNGDTIYE